MDKFPETQNPPTLNPKEIKILTRAVTNKGTESVIKNLLTKERLEPDGFMDGFYRVFQVITNHLKLFQKLKKTEYLQIPSIKPALP